MQGIEQGGVFDFTREFGWNPQEAELMGVSPYLSWQTPVGYARAAFGQFERAFATQDGKPKFCADRNGRVVPCDSPERVPGGRSGETSGPIIGTGPGGVQSPGWEPEEVWVDDQGNVVAPGTPGAQKSTIFGRASGLKEAIGITGDDLFKRGALLLLAIVLIAIAVVSFR